MSQNAIQRWVKQPGVFQALPVLLFLIIGFVGPLAVVVAFGFMPPNTFSLLQAPTLANYYSIFSESYYIPFTWSLVLALATVSISFIVCYPVAYGMAKAFGKWANLITIIIAVPILISENIRLFGWVLIFVKNGILDGLLQQFLGVSFSGVLYSVPAILMGLVYVYLPFMLFPMVLGMSMVPETLKEAAADLGASRFEIFKEVELPLSMPGLLIGVILTFVLALGALVESKILGGQSIVMVADEIESAFTFGQNWPKGSAISTLLILLSGVIVLFLFKRIDLDRILGRR
jgi:spermidine/putrescine transport system permease protein